MRGLEESYSNTKQLEYLLLYVLLLLASRTVLVANSSGSHKYILVVLRV